MLNHRPKLSEQNRTDRRIRKTRQSIQQALIRLAYERDTTSVTVTDVCKSADINRSTFYAHFYDIQDVVESIEQETVDRIFDLCETTDFCALMQDPYPVLRRISEELGQSPEKMEFVRRSSKAPGFIEKLKAAFRTRLIKDYETRTGKPIPERLCVAIGFYTSGVTDVYAGWIKSESKLSLDELCAILSVQMKHGFRPE